MTRQEMIEKLKDPERAQPFCLLSSEEQAILKEGGASCLYLSWRDNAAKWNPMHFVRIEGNKNVYILGPGYQPKPKWNDIAIVLNDGWLGVYSNATPYHFMHLHTIPSMPNFHHFCHLNHLSGEMSMSAISRCWQKGDNIVARFMKE